MQVHPKARQILITGSVASSVLGLVLLAGYWLYPERVMPLLLPLIVALGMIDVTAVFFVYGWPTLSYNGMVATGKTAEAVVLHVTEGTQVFTRGRKRAGSRPVTHKQLQLTLEIKPSSEPPYETTAFVMTRIEDATKLKTGSRVQVKIHRVNPQKVAVLPETAVPPVEYQDYV